MTILRGMSIAIVLLASSAWAEDAPERSIDFNRDIRPILSNACNKCHGPDAKARKGLMNPLRLDTEEGALADLGGYSAIVKGNPDESEMIRRITSDDENETMPPVKSGKTLSPHDIQILKDWVRQGAPYAKHWSYVKPQRPPLPAVKDESWPRNEIDRFLLAKLDAEGLRPSPEASRHALIRRVSLDLIGLPPTPEEVDAFVHDDRPDAYERLVDRLLASPAYGEFWGRLWLDLARYADSAGYADDPPRTIWAYRDYVIRSFNANKPFDQFTIEQIAGDLLPNPSEDQLTATAFHRNTLTNNEGGTSDEEFRSVAVVDRVNTTMAVWMGTTIACNQCHDHKYDPLSQKEYFQLYSFFNQSEDADRGDESPLLPIFSDATKARKAALQDEITSLETVLKTATPETSASQKTWEASIAGDLPWTALAPSSMTSQSGATLKALDDQSILATPGGKTDTTTVTFPLTGESLTALRLDALADDSLPNRGPGHAGGNFVVSRISAIVSPPNGAKPSGRFVRVELPGKGKFLSLAEVQVFRGAENIAPGGIASQINTAYDGPAKLAIDGNTNGLYAEAKSTTHTEASDDPWWEVDLKNAGPIDRVVVWNRTDAGVGDRLKDFRVVVLNDNHEPVWSQTVSTPPSPSVDLAPSGDRPVDFLSAFADHSQPDFDASNLINNKNPGKTGWAVGGSLGQDHHVTLVARTPLKIEPGSTLTVTIDQTTEHANHTLGRFRIAATGDERASQIAAVPSAMLAIAKTPPDARTADQSTALEQYYLANVAPELKASREALADRKAQLAAIKPDTTVPIMRELPEAQRRTTRIHNRGNFLDPGDEVLADVPAVFPPLPSDAPRDRLALARWLVDEENPLTARVVANRYWEQIFGTGLVATSEEFGAQGDPPSHPELLDWLATEMIRDGWDLKAFLRKLVTSAAYRQDSRVPPDLMERDPDNRLLARGPRLRLAAETIRDQALSVAGLLSPKMFGPPVKPPQPKSGLSAAFGGGIDWETSQGADRYRRGLYTMWRRSNPYPSMTTFDAPNRETCTLRRTRTNTPLQALVTLNDPVYVEAAQSFARRIAKNGSTPEDRARFAFRVALCRPGTDAEIARVAALYQSAYDIYAHDPDEAKKLATDPLGPAPEGADVAELASWTVVANVILNLDEMLMKP